MAHEPLHTPGPWTYGWMGNPDVHGRDEAGPITVVATWRGGVADCVPIPSGHASTWEVVEANARLISTAPDLFAIVKEFAADGSFTEWPAAYQAHVLAVIATAEGT